MVKPKLATAHLTGCFGCHMSLLDMDEQLLELVQFVDLDKSPFTDFKQFTGPCDIGLIEGGISNAEQLETIHNCRRYCRILVSVGECAIEGNIPAYRNLYPLRECLEEAFIRGPSVTDGMIPDDPDIPLLLNKVYPVQEVVKVDYFLPGCPPSHNDFWIAINAILKNKPIEIPYYQFKKD